MRLRIGTRSSTLAMAQTEAFIRSVNKASPQIEAKIVPVTTLGDSRQETPQAVIADKRKWIHELELALLQGTIDVAVHSGKDVPSIVSEQTALLPVLSRSSAFDVFIGRKINSAGERLAFREIEGGGAVGTASLRRQAQLLRARPDLRVLEHRGNVLTRLQKLEDTTRLAGIVLAEAGLRRLGLDNIEYEVLKPEMMLPAINQGMLVVQYNSERHDVAELLEALVEGETLACYQAERSCVLILEADCHSSIGAFAVVKANQLTLSVRVLSADGSECVEAVVNGSLGEAWKVGRKAAEIVLAQGAAGILDEARRTVINNA